MFPHAYEIKSASLKTILNIDYNIGLLAARIPEIIAWHSYVIRANSQIHNTE